MPKPLLSLARLLTAILFLAAGISHFTNAPFFQSIVPPYLPNPALLVFISGIAEIAGTLGLLIPKLRRPAAYGLIALLIAVFPANIFMAQHPDQIPGLHLSPLLLYLRLPLQGLLILWVYYISRPTPHP